VLETVSRRLPRHLNNLLHISRTVHILPPQLLPPPTRQKHTSHSGQLRLEMRPLRPNLLHVLNHIRRLLARLLGIRGLVQTRLDLARVDRKDRDSVAGEVVLMFRLQLVELELQTPCEARDGGFACAVGGCPGAGRKGRLGKWD